MSAYETWLKNNERVRIVRDEDPENPRDWQSDETTLVANHRRYNLGDREPESDDEYAQRQADETLVVLPVYMYEHSGISLSTGAFGCPWDSGQVGFIYAQRQGKETHDDVVERLKGEIETYSQYLQGLVYGFIREKKKQCEHCGAVEWEHIDSCWGYIGYPNSTESGLYEEAFPEGRDGWELSK
jgi:hypothetical protein